MKFVTQSMLLLVALAFLAVPASSQYSASKKSDKFHKTTCRYVKQISDENLIAFETADEAVEAGYRACRVCKPGGKKATVGTKSSADPPAATTGRCQATTRKGTQCKRKAKQGSSYCWQHE